MAGDKITRVAAIGTGTIGQLDCGVPGPRADTRRPFCVNLSPRRGQALLDCRHYLPSRPGRR